MSGEELVPLLDVEDVQVQYMLYVQIHLAIMIADLGCYMSHVIRGYPTV